MRKLATIETIQSLQPHPNADTLELAKVRGWQVVVKRGEFKEGDRCVYCEIDSVLPERPEFEFLRDRKFRIKTIKLRGELSQGIAFPSLILDVRPTKEWQEDWQVGDDVTDHLGVTLYQPPMPACLGGDVEGPFPAFIPKTDCERIQNHPWILSELAQVEWVATEKLDGSSCTVMWDDERGLQVCSRNWNLRSSDSNAYWRAVANLDLENKFRGSRLAWQGALLGPKVQGNAYQLSDYTICFFDAYDLENHCYLDFNEYRKAAADLQLPMVPLIHYGLSLPHDEAWIAELLLSAEGKSALKAQTEREGLVWRPLQERHDYRIGRVVFKAISNRFLLKSKE